MNTLRFARVDDLGDPDQLARLVGPIASIDRIAIATTGFSAARHERLRLRLESGGEHSLVLKRVWPRLDWTAKRTGDTRGREALLLEERSLRAIWSVFRCPYRAYAVEEEETGLLMDDLAPFLPQIDAPLTERQEDELLAHLAALHARFWTGGNARTGPLGLSWLTPLPRRFSILGPGIRHEEAGSSRPLMALARHGWEVALERLPPRGREIVLRAPEEVASGCASLPQTLLHGDAKVDNFAFLGSGRMAAFDWAVMGVGPATLDVGYHLAVNWQRLPHAKEEALARYRSFLEEELGAALSESMWEGLTAAAVLAGSLKLLWSKALALEAGAPGAGEEWDWWVDSLIRRAS